MIKWTEDDINLISNAVANDRVIDVESSLIQMINSYCVQLLPEDKHKKSTKNHQDYKEIRRKVVNILEHRINGEYVPEEQESFLVPAPSIFASQFTDEEAELLKLVPQGINDLLTIVQEQSQKIINLEQQLKVVEKQTNTTRMNLQALNSRVYDDIDEKYNSLDARINERYFSKDNSSSLENKIKVSKPKVGIIGVSGQLFNNLNDQLKLRTDLFLIGPGNAIPDVDYVLSCDVARKLEAEKKLGASRIWMINPDFLSLKMKLHEIANRHYSSNQ